MKPLITVEDVQGAISTHEVECGESLMELLRSLGQVDAVCGGGASCGTCSVQVPPEWCDRLPAPDSIEAALLEAFDGEPGIRLSCQLCVTPEINGLMVRVKPLE